LGIKFVGGVVEKELQNFYNNQIKI